MGLEEDASVDDTVRKAESAQAVRVGWVSWWLTGVETKDKKNTFLRNQCSCAFTTSVQNESTFEIHLEKMQQDAIFQTL